MCLLVWEVPSVTSIPGSHVKLGYLSTYNTHLPLARKGKYVPSSYGDRFLR